MMLNLGQGEYLGVNNPYQSRASLHFVDTAYHQKVFNGWHAHEAAHLTLVLNGGNLEKREAGEKTLLTGDVIFYHSHEMHRNDHTIFPSRNLNLEIEHAFFDRYDIGEQQIAGALTTGKITSLEMARLFQETVLSDPISADSLHLLLLSFLQSPEKKVPSWLYKVQEMLHDNWYQWPTLTDLSSAAQVHPVTLSKYFHRFFGCTLGSYMRRLKTQHALVMIRSGKYQLSEICHYCGFADQSHFIRIFKDATGMLPKKFEKL